VATAMLRRVSEQICTRLLRSSRVGVAAPARDLGSQEGAQHQSSTL
jgi:hypothetical protein